MGAVPPIERVIPIRLPWIKRRMEVLSALVAELESRWSAGGRMADGSLRDDEK